MSVVLIIDDEPQMRSMMRRVLAAAGHSVVEAGNGREGLAAFQSYAPDIVITDIIMPEKEGIETIIELCQATHRAKIIAVSGSFTHEGPDFLTMASRFGADVVLQKPFRAAELQHAVERLTAAARTDSVAVQ
ncbi:MAG TPA: response regulator transcription factor [Rhizomicrobium sp.]|jgi:CheY-like chemotaxis protein|nr:response regulator transcription factor [Rhizomicrobium sp.]